MDLAPCLFINIKEEKMASNLRVIILLGLAKMTNKVISASKNRKTVHFLLQKKGYILVKNSLYG